MKEKDKINEEYVLQSSQIKRKQIEKQEYDSLFKIRKRPLPNPLENNISLSEHK